MTAKLMTNANLVSGEWVQQDGMEPSYVVTKSGEKVSRARIMATVVSKFMSDDGNFGSITIDDGTDTLRAKCFKDLTPLEKAEVGSLVDLTGKVREYNGEVYMIPEIIKRIDDPNYLLLRKAELSKKAKEKRPAGEEPVSPAAPDKRNELRDKILGLIEASAEGIEYAKLIEQSGQTEDKVDSIINDLLSEGICYEPTPGKIKKI